MPRQPMVARLLFVLTAWCGLLPAAVVAAPTRTTSLAQFDAGFTRCEKQYPDLRGQGDAVYASLYRLRLDDDLRSQLAETRKSALYKSDRRRAQQTIAKNVAASGVAQRTELQCRALRRELKSGTAAGATAANAAATTPITPPASAAKR